MPRTAKQRHLDHVRHIEAGHFSPDWEPRILDRDFDELHVPPLTTATAYLQYPSTAKPVKKVAMPSAQRRRTDNRIASIERAARRHYTPLPLPRISAHYRDRFTLARHRFEVLLYRHWWKHWRELYSLTDFPRSR